MLPDENFVEAKRLKLVIEELSKAGEVLCRFEVEKKEAIIREDYDTAKAKKVDSCIGSFFMRYLICTYITHEQAC